MLTKLPETITRQAIKWNPPPPQGRGGEKTTEHLAEAQKKKQVRCDTPGERDGEYGHKLKTVEFLSRWHKVPVNK